MLILKRHQLFLTGVSLVFLFYFLNKTWFLIGSETTPGTCTEYDVIYPEGRSKDPDRFFPIIEYSVNGKNYKLTGIEDLKLDEEESITVIYKKNDPARAYQFSFFGFWYYGILYGALSIIALTILCYGAFEKHHSIRIRIPFIKFNTLPEKKGKEKDKNNPVSKQ
ncbi:MAG: hypothetical protein ACJ76F_03090 [Bacteroidia bacterium]